MGDLNPTKKVRKNLQFILRLSLTEKKFQKRMFTLRSQAVPRGWPMLFSVVLMAASVHGCYMIRDPDNPDSIIGSSTHETVWLRCSSCNTPQYYDLRFTESGPKALKAYTFEGENGTLWCVQKSKENAFLEQCVVLCNPHHEVANRSSMFSWVTDQQMLPWQKTRNTDEEQRIRGYNPHDNRNKGWRSA